MALRLNERYPGRFDNPTTSYPQGAFKNRSAPGAQDGSYLEKDWANDPLGFFGRLLTVAGMTPNGTVDTALSSQYYDALDAIFAKLASPAFSGTPTAPTASTPTNTTQIATTAFVKNVIATLGTAASRNVGTGANQIPDINSFTHVTDSGSRHLYSVPMTDGIFRTYVFQVNLPIGTTTLTLPVPFPTTVTSANISQVSQVSVPTGNLAVQINSANVIQMVNWSNTAVTAQVYMTGR